MYITPLPTVRSVVFSKKNDEKDNVLDYILVHRTGDKYMISLTRGYFKSPVSEDNPFRENHTCTELTNINLDKNEMNRFINELSALNKKEK